MSQTRTHPHQLSLSDSLPVGSKQKSKVKSGFTPLTTHGGLESQGRRKAVRPFTPKTSMHIVLKSHRAKGLWSMKHRKHHSKIRSMVYVYAQRFRITVYAFANVGDHLHLHVKAKNRKDLADYLRVLAGRVAVTVTGARKFVKRINPIGKVKFWSHLCWSRLVKWQKDFRNVSRYIFANYMEEFYEGNLAKGMRMSVLGQIPILDEPPW